MEKNQNGEHGVITNVSGADGVDGEYEPFSDAVEAMVNECLRLAILAEVIEEREEEEEEGKKMIRYELMHDGSVLHTLATKNPDADIGMINLMIKLSDGNEGEFSIYSVELDPETGNEKYTWVASIKGGVEI